MHECRIFWKCPSISMIWKWVIAQFDMQLIYQDHLDISWTCLYLSRDSGVFSSWIGLNSGRNCQEIFLQRRCLCLPWNLTGTCSSEFWACLQVYRETLAMRDKLRHAFVRFCGSSPIWHSLIKRSLTLISQSFFHDLIMHSNVDHWYTYISF